MDSVNDAVVFERVIQLERLRGGQLDRAAGSAGVRMAFFCCCSHDRFATIGRTALALWAADQDLLRLLTHQLGVRPQES